MANILQIEVCNSVQEAPNYNRDHIDIRAASILKCVIVKGGTASGKPTVDFQFVDAQGAMYVAMLTGELVKQLSNAVEGAS